MLRFVVVVGALLGSLTALAADKTYQVTGPVVEVSPNKIVVEKGKDKWELARNASTKASAEPKVGDKVTIMYTMTATDIEVKSSAKEPKGAAKK